VSERERGAQTTRNGREKSSQTDFSKQDMQRFQGDLPLHGNRRGMGGGEINFYHHPVLGERRVIGKYYSEPSEKVNRRASFGGPGIIEQSLLGERFREKTWNEDIKRNPSS